MLLNHMIQVVLSLAVSMLSAWAPFMFYSTSPDNEPVAVRHVEGLVHGFLVLRTLEGKVLAEGDLIQTADGDRVTSKLIFRFKDGSSRSETAVFSQSHTFQLLSDHLIEKGPSFKNAADTIIDCTTREITVHYTDKDGKAKADTARLELPGNLANGLMFTLLKNIDSAAPRTTLSMVAAPPKPRLVKLAVRPLGDDFFFIAGSKRKAMHYAVKVEIGGVAGVVAPLVGKQPPESDVWILEGEAPAFLKFEGPLYEGGPIWRIELTNPTWPDANSRRW